MLHRCHSICEARCQIPSAQYLSSATLCVLLTWLRSEAAGCVSVQTPARRSLYYDAHETRLGRLLLRLHLGVRPALLREVCAGLGHAMTQLMRSLGLCA